jgi:meso-butanediol dehydrogenase / (S,S)-butanediol dehydrogenase / diacetyl reductase
MISNDTPRVVLVTRATEFVGAALCRALARRGHRLLVHDAPTALLSELHALGVSVEAVSIDEVPLIGVGSLSTAEGWNRLVERALSKFGRLDSAAIYPPSGTTNIFCTGTLMTSAVQELQDLFGYLPSTMHALKALISAMRRTGAGQILVFTSDAGARPEPGWAIYGAVRAGQSFLVQAAALEHAAENISINALGSKNVVGPGFPGAPANAIFDDEVIVGDWSRTLIAETPARRLGTMAELAAFCVPLLDGTSRFQTAQCFSYSGGWNTARAG